MEIREFFSSSESSVNSWEEWELRMMVLLSLLLQILLIGLGNQRKYTATKWISILLWLAYLSADSVATNALGVLSRSQKKYCESKSLDSNYVIMAFWAPFLLLHLGGPDTITAYSLEDNELWSRHLLVLILEALMAFYVFYKSFKATAVNFVAIPVFIAGLIKYGERTWALRSASSQYLKSSLISRPDPGPNYAKFMEEYGLRDIEGYRLSLNAIPDPQVMPCTFASGRNTLIQDAETLNVAYDFFLTYKRLFADLILSFQDLQKSQSYFKDTTWDTAFRIIEIELGFMYDLLFTKATIVYSIWGAILRFISLSSTVVALILFIWIIDWHAYSQINVDISLLLLCGAIGLEIYAIIIMLYSDWTMLWLSNNNHLLANTIYKVISPFRFLIGKRRWSNSIAQHNLVNSCFKDEPAKCCMFLKVTWLYELVEKFKDEPLKDVSHELNVCIFNQILDKSNSASDFRDYKKLCNSRGDWVLEKNDCYVNKLDWSVEVEFDQSILLWHIATDLCYYSDYSKDKSFVSNSDCEVSRLLSDYMMHILVKLPFMLPDGIGQIRLQDTKAEAKEFIRDRKFTLNQDACLQLLEVDTRIEPSIVKGDRSKSVLFDACRVAKLLQSIEAEKRWDKQRKWEMISHVWVELLCYAASHCRWNHHAQQLKRGGELLTHVWLLMAHLGITEQFQISKGHARAKLIVE
ncbi:hypothetical protein ACOSP7_016000 [Xanthoceras sorbifolium]